jgi:hypothetical protein
MYLITVWLAAIIMMAGSFWYCYQILREEVQPPPATFIIVSCTFPLGFYMYTQTPGWSFAANIGLATAVASAWVTTATLIGKLLYEKKLQVELTVFQRITVGTSFLVLIFWAITNDPFTAYVLLQVSALIGYIPVIQKLWGAKRNHDSIIFWGSLFFSTLVGCYAAYEKNDIQSWIYIGRALPSTLAVLVLMLIAESKQKANR